MPKGRNGTRRSTQTTQGSYGPKPFVDTVNLLMGESAGTTEVYSYNSLLPSLVGRTVVMKKMVVEYLPLLSVTGVPYTSNVFFNFGGTGDRLLASGPFKILSNVNPTRFVVDVSRLARTAPAVLEPFSSDSTQPVLSLRFGIAPTASQEIRVRITSTCDVYPQESFELVPT